MVRVTRLIAAFIFVSALPAAGQRLPGTVVPEHYSLWFAPDLEKETFRGRASIDVVLTEPSTTITLNAAEIEFGEVTITSGGRTQTARVTLDPSKEMATLTVPQAIGEGRATIRTTYSGILNDKLRGFYISKANGRKYAISQMEATDARRAFPSFDEPAFKATFDIALMIDMKDSAISNGRQISDTPGPEPGKHTVTFARTAKMSTYLAAMLVGDFVCRSGSSDGIVVRVCSTPDKMKLTGFALEAAEQQLAFYNTYFGIKYPFGKLDIIGVPDFSAGAMENAGAITFRERLLLVDPAASSIQLRKRVAQVIAHEIAHQWFGDLVTMKWWDDIWLNEGFATWMANKPVAAWRPQWHVELDDTDDTRGALGIDAMRSTRPIRMKVETPAEINEVFDGIAYEKTAGVLRMIESYVGPDAFRKGVASYLKRFSYANAAGEDFWNEVASVTGKPVDKILRSFVDQAGAPALVVTNRCVGGTTEVSLSMQRFVGVPDAAPDTSQVWTLPACLRTPGGATKCEIIDHPTQSIRLDGCGASGSEAPVLANAGSRGYYFSEYTPAAARALAESSKQLSAGERLGLLSDEWWMVRAGRHDIDAYLDVSNAFATDTSSAVTDAVAGRLGTIDDLVKDADRPHFQAWIRSRFGPQLAALGLPGPAKDDEDIESRRATLLSLVGLVGNDPAVQRQARDLARQYLKDSGSLPGTLAPIVLEVAAVAGDQELYDRYVKQLPALSAQPEEYYRLLNALPWFSDPALVRRTLDFAVSSSVRTQDTSTLIGILMGRPASRETAWAFVREQWPTLMKTLGEFQGIPRIVESVGAFCSTSKAQEVRDFFTRNPVASSQRAVTQSIERIESCAALEQRQAKPLEAWIRRQ